MNTKLTVLPLAFALAGALALSACNNNSSSPAPGAAPAATATAPMEAPPPATSTVAAAPAVPPAAASTASGKPTAVVKDCATEIEGNDAMQYNVSSIVVPASCKDFKITLKHTGKLPVTSMGHDVVITKASDMQAVDAAGMSAGAADGYVKPDDPQVIAHTKLIGAGETTSVSFPVSKIQGDGPYEFFCSFPGHSALMHGSISVQ
jgi:azurin